MNLLLATSFKRYLLVHVPAVDATAEQGRLGGPLPPARPQRLGPAKAQVGGAGRLQLRPRGRREPRGAPAPGRVRHPVPRPRCRPGRVRRRPAVHRVPPARRHLGPGCPVGAARDREGDASPAQRAPAGRERRAGAVRPGREPGAGPVIEAGRRPLGQRGRAGRGPARHQRRRLLPGDGLADGDHRRPGAEGLRQPRHPAQPRGRRAVLRHHLHLLRDAGRGRARAPRRSRHAPGRRERRQRRGRGPGTAAVPDLGEIQGPPRRPAPGRDRDGRDQGR